MVDVTEYRPWFDEYVDQFGLKREGGKLGMLFCASFDVNDPAIEQVDDDRAVLILIRSRDHLEYEMKAGD